MLFLSVFIFIPELALILSCLNCAFKSGLDYRSNNCFEIAIKWLIQMRINWSWTYVHMITFFNIIFSITSVKSLVLYGKWCHNRWYTILYNLIICLYRGFTCIRIIRIINILIDMIKLAFNGRRIQHNCLHRILAHN